MEPLTSEASETCEPPTSPATCEPTSSPASEDGTTPCASPDGPTTIRSGPEAAHASRSAAPAIEPEPMTLDIFGPSSSASSESADLQLSLESRLRALTDTNGSPEFALTWSRKGIGLGPRICRLRASGRRTSGSGSSGWPTPKSGGRSTAHGEMRGTRASTRTGQKIQRGLGRLAKFARLARPQSRAGQLARRAGVGWQDGTRLRTLAGWGTPRSVETGHSTGNAARASDRKSRIEDQAMGAAGWETPTHRGRQVERPQDTQG